MKYDIIVLGSGPGGYVTAIRASQLGFKVAVIEKENLGGICLNWGCIPTKALLKSAQVFDYLKHASDYGLTVKEFDKDFNAVVKRSRDVAEGMSKGVQFLMKKNKITVYTGVGSFESKTVINITKADGTKEQIESAKTIIATGSKPFIPPVQGVDLKGVISFRDIYDVNTMIKYCETKKNAVVIGGGLLGLEAAYGLKQRGMNVTVLHLMDRIMERQLDGRASRMLRNSIEEKGINIITEANTEALIGKDGHVNQVRLKDGTVLDADLVIFAVGIRPNIALAQSAGLRCNRGILVNDTMQTFDPSIYAVGECIEHRSQTFGLVEPLWGQAFICATHLAEHGSLTFKSPTVPTQLKVSGVDVFSAGNFEPKEDYEDIILNDEKRQIYKRIIIQKDKVIGAVLFGDTEDGMWYAELIADQTPVSTFRNKLLFGKDFAMKKAG